MLNLFRFYLIISGKNMKKALLLLAFSLISTISFSQYTVDFEGPSETKGAYGTGNVTLSGLDWTFTEALIGTLANDYKNGARSARLRGRNGSVITMIDDKTTGLGTISFTYRQYGTDGAQQPWAVEYSTNSGGSWTQIGTDITPTATIQTFSEALNITGNVRVRVRINASPGTTGDRRFNIDDIVLTDNACVPATISGYSPATGPVGTSITITASSGDLTGATATFGGVAANVVSSSATQLVIEVPNGATGTDIVITDATSCDATVTGFTVINSDSTSCDFVASFTDLFISEVTDASAGSLSYIEIFNATGATVDMTDYEVQIRNNGNPTGTDITLTGTLAHGDSFILATAVGSGCSVPGGNGEYADQTDVSSGVNNNDCIHLARLGTRIDTWGVCDGSNWITTAGYGTAGYDFQRQNAATAPTTTFNISDWNVIDYDSCNDSYDNIENYVGANPTPTITSQPTVSLSPCDISTTLSVSATEGTAGGQALAYQWYVSAPGDAGWTALTDTGVYSGTNTNTLAISSVIGLDDYQYYCQVRESGATCYQASEAVRIDVTLASVWNGASWSTLPDNTKLVFIDGDYDTATQGSFEACNLQIDAGATLDIRAGDYVLVVNDLIVDGDLQVHHEGSFVQVNDAGDVMLNAGGNIDVHKTTANLADWWAYTFWSSPIVDETIGGALATSNPNYRFVFNPANYSDILPADGLDDNGDDWTFTGPGVTMTPGLGYVAMGPTTGTYPQTQSIAFNGELNNGVVNVPISIAGNPDTWNLIGNPYASAIDIDKFHAANNTTVEGTIYLWNHISAPLASNSGPYGQNFDTDDFATYNVALGTGTAANSGGAIPTQYIASGQSFFIRGLVNGTASFNNAMRETGNNGGFYFAPTTPEASESTTNKDLLWINITSPETRVFNQILLGFVQGASNGIDNYDSKVRNSPYISLYSISEGEGLKIQGREALINAEERIPLGIISKVSHEQRLTFSIGQFEGFNILDYGIYLEDRQEKVLHDLKVSNYDFTLEEGTFNNRFALVLKKEILSSDDSVEELPDTNLIITENNGALIFKAPRNKKIDGVQVYDMLGKLIINKEAIDNEVYSTNATQLNTAVYIVVVTYEDGSSENKKFIKR